MNVGTTCCLPSPPCGAFVCHELSSSEECGKLLEKQSSWCPDPNHCREQVISTDDTSWPTWDDVVYPFIIVPCATQLAMFFIWPISACILRALCRNSDFRWFVLTYIGSIDNPIPRSQSFLQYLCVFQIVASLWGIGVFIFNSYNLSIVPAVRFTGGILGVFHSFHYVVFAIRKEFRMRYILDAGRLIDIFTVPNMLMVCLNANSNQSWINLNFLRAARALHAYELLDNLGALRLGMGEIAHEIVLMLFRFITLVVYFASSVLLLEVLGELPFFASTEDEAIVATSMGNITLFRMLYWVIQTVSTVGYGEYAPKTFCSRLVTMFGTIGGVAFFTVELNRIFNIAAKQRGGSGEYLKTKRDHIVLLGGAVQSVDSTLILAFLDELYHVSYRNSFPDLVIMSQPQSIDKLREIVELHLDTAAHQHITYLVGSPLKLSDLKRCRCDVAVLVLIIADTTGQLDPYQEDKLNILRTLSLKTGFSETPFRLMLLMSESKVKAMSVGIRQQRCFSSNDIRSGLVWTSCRCIGWNTMFSNIVVTHDPSEFPRMDFAKSPWYENYLAGMDNEMYGFIAAKEFCGKPFRKFILEAYTRNGACIFAAQINGRIELAPLHCEEVVDSDMVFFALADSEESLKGIALKPGSSDWKTIFSQNRQQVFDQEDATRRKQAISADATVDEMRSISGNADGDMPGVPGANIRASIDLRSSFFSFGHTVSNASRQSAIISEPFRPISDVSESFQSNSHSFDSMGSLNVNYGSSHEALKVGRQNGASLEDRIVSDRQAKSVQVNSFPLKLSAYGLSPQPSEFLGDATSDLGSLDQFSSYFEEIGADEINQLFERAQIIRKDQAPFVLLLDLSGSWVQVTSFISRQSSEDLPFSMPIVVLTDVPPPRDVAERLGLLKDSSLGVVVGHPVWAEDLQISGVQECSVIVCLGVSHDGTAGGGEEPEMLDADVVMLQSMLELLGEGRKNMILEFKRAQNTRLLPNLSAEPNSWLPSFDKATAAESTSCACEWIPTCGKAAEVPNEGHYCLDPHYASGQIFTPHVLGAMVACEYRMPGIIEMTGIMVTPSSESCQDKSKAMMVWQVRLKKEHRHMSYGEVFTHLVNDPAEPALPLGILRNFQQAVTCGFGYVWTNPGKDTIMESSDLIFVLARTSFGHAAYKRGILPFAGKDKSAGDFFNKGVKSKLEVAKERREEREALASRKKEEKQLTRTMSLYTTDSPTRSSSRESDGNSPKSPDPVLLPSATQLFSNRGSSKPPPLYTGATQLFSVEETMCEAPTHDSQASK